MENVPFLFGPLTATLDEALKKHKIHMQAYHGRSFVGNHCHRYLKEEIYTDVCESVKSKTNFVTIKSSLQMEAEKDVKQIQRTLCFICKSTKKNSHKNPITCGKEIKSFELDIKQYLHLFRLSFPYISITQKQHILECHCIDYIKRFQCGLGGARSAM